MNKKAYNLYYKNAMFAVHCHHRIKEGYACNKADVIQAECHHQSLGRQSMY